MTDSQKSGPGPGPPGEVNERERREPVVVRDRRRVKLTDDQPTADRPTASEGEAAGQAGPDQAGEAPAQPAAEPQAPETQPAAAAAQAAEPEPPAGESRPTGDAASTPADPEATGESAGAPAGEPAEAPAGEPAEAAPVAAATVDSPAEPAAAPAPAQPAPAVPDPELAGLRDALAERTQDLQRVTAEYANYRKRAERMRAQAGEEAVAGVFRALLPVFDDLERARAHGELSEGVAAVVEQLVAAAGKFGLVVFGEPGDPFDPNRHEAVAHQLSTEVDEPTCVEVLRRGYLLGERLLRPAMVAVAAPESG